MARTPRKPKVAGLRSALDALADNHKTSPIMPSERSIQRQILAWMARVMPADAIWQHVANQTASGAGYMMELMRDGLRPGWPDLNIVHLGRLYCLEVKRPGGRVSPSQRECHAALARAGVDVRVVYSVEDAQAAVLLWGIPLAGLLKADAPWPHCLPPERTAR